MISLPALSVLTSLYKHVLRKLLPLTTANFANRVLVFYSNVVVALGIQCTFTSSLGRKKADVNCNPIVGVCVCHGITK